MAVRQLNQQVLAFIAEGRQAWPDFDVDVRRVATEFERRPALVEGSTGPHAKDLYLAQALLQGDRRALEHFRDAILPAVMSACPRGDPAEWRARLEDRLFFPSDTRPPRLAAYEGRSSLIRWLRAVAARLWVDLTREVRTVEPQAVLELLVDGRDTPERSTIRAQSKQVLSELFSTALATLTPRERLLVKMHLVDHRTIDDLGALYGVHRTTAFRWLEAARHKLIVAVRQNLARHAGTAGTQSAGFQASVELSISRLMGEAP